jgi:hypothetical protein
MNTSDAIKQRHVDPDLISYHEQLGTCMGRVPQKPALQIKEFKGKPCRHL